jgi:FlaA1/EpsC-like NDP-sugar epimerase
VSARTSDNQEAARTRYEFYSAVNQRILDALTGGVAFYLACQLRFEWQVPPIHAYQMWVLLPAVMLGHVLVNSTLGVYRLVWRYVSLKDALVIGRSCLAFSAILMMMRIGFPDRWWMARAPYSVIAIEFLLALFGTLSARALRRLLDERSQTQNLVGVESRRLLLFGAGRAGVMVAREIASSSDLRPVGFLDDDPKKNRTVIGGLRVLGSLDSLPRVVREHNIQEVVVCIPRIRRDVLRKVWALAESVAIATKIVPTIEEILQKKTNIAAFRNVEPDDLLEREPATLSVTDPALVAAYQGKRILITGGGGSIGSELACQVLALKPAQIILLDKDENGLHDCCVRLRGRPRGPEVHPVVADLRFASRLEDVFRRFHPEVVFHAAAHKHVHLMEISPCEAILNNVVGTHHLVDQALEFGVSRFALISTDKAVKPTCIMGASKRLCEMIVQARALKGRTQFSCVRFGNVIGSRGSVVPLFTQQIVGGGPVTVTHPDVERFLMTIPEAASLVIQAGTLGASGEIFVLEMGDPVRIQNLARELIELSGLRPEKDIEIRITQLQEGEKMSEQLLDESTERLLPTCYEKIAAVASTRFDVAVFERRLRMIEEAARHGSAAEVFQVLSELNIGFHRGHSIAAPSNGDPHPKAVAAAASHATKL